MSKSIHISANNANIKIQDSNNVNVASVNVSEQKTFTNDFSHLSETLSENKVAPADIDLLEKAIVQDTDSQEHSSEDFGQHVMRWYRGMMDKAQTGAWDVSFGVAASLLASSISAYYGWFK